MKSCAECRRQGDGADAAPPSCFSPRVRVGVDCRPWQTAAAPGALLVSEVALLLTNLSHSLVAN
ncbi:protein of unknown function [Magnetospirillum sp. XM-1]|nr:protein of unknown function [Magnetospirillum sp. XM-1]